MKPVTAQFLSVALVISASSVELCARDSHATPVAQRTKTHEPVELFDVIRPGAKPLEPGMYKLSREWVGTLTTIGDEYAKNGLVKEPTESVRFNFVSVSPDNSIRLESIRISPKGEASGPIGFNLTRKPLGADKILKTRNLATLKSWFGNQHGLTDGWGSDEHMHWSEGWKYFYANPDGTITCQNIFAHVSEKRKVEKTPESNDPSKFKIISREAAQVDIMNLRQGVFRPEKTRE